MKTLEEQIEDLREWFEDGCVGNVIVFRSPRASLVDSIVEETIKLNELDRDARALVEQVFALFDCERMEFFRNGKGDPDRVKVVRRG